KKVDVEKVPLKMLGKYNGMDSIVCHQVAKVQRKKLSTRLQKLTRLTTRMSRVSDEMERLGIGFDVAYSKKLEDKLTKELEELENKIRSFAGDRELNVSAPHQVGQLIFERLELHKKAKLHRPLD